MSKGKFKQKGSRQSLSQYFAHKNDAWEKKDKKFPNCHKSFDTCPEVPVTKQRVEKIVVVEGVEKKRHKTEKIVAERCLRCPMHFGW